MSPLLKGMSRVTYYLWLGLTVLDRGKSLSAEFLKDLCPSIERNVAVNEKSATEVEGL